MYTDVFKIVTDRYIVRGFHLIHSIKYPIMHIYLMVTNLSENWLNQVDTESASTEGMLVVKVQPVSQNPLL